MEYWLDYQLSYRKKERFVISVPHVVPTFIGFRFICYPILASS